MRLPGRRSALDDVTRCSCVQDLAISVRNGPAESVFTRTFGPYSCAKDKVIAFSAALEQP